MKMNSCRLAFILLLLPLLAACLAGDDVDPTATPVPEATVAEPSATPAATMAPATATDEPADAPSVSQTAPAAEAQATSTTLAQDQTLRFDATPAPETAPTTAPAEGIPYELVGTIGEPMIPQAPSDIDILEDGSIVVADAGRSEIQIFSADGELRSSWPALGFNPWNDSFRPGSPEHVAAGHGSYYVGISQFGGVALYGDAGDLRAQFVFNHPSTTLFDLTLGPDGRIYAVVGSFRTGQPDDADPFGIYVFDAELNLVEIWESGAQFIPIAIAFDKAGLLHSLVVRGNAGSSGANLSQPARFVVLDPGDYDPSAWDAPDEFELEGWFDGLAITADGSYVLIEEASNDPRDNSSTIVHVTTPDGEALDRWEIKGHAASQVRTSAGMILSADDRLILADTIGQRILILELDGEIVSEWRDDPAHLSAPSGIAINADGDLAVLDVPSQEISIFGAGESEPERFPIDVLYFHPELGTYGEMFFGADNDIWYIDVNEASPFSLRRLNLDTGAIEPFTADASSPFVFSPARGVVGDDGLLYLAMDSDGTVRSFTPDGEMIDTWPVGDDHPVHQVIDVALGPDGVYILWSGEVDGNGGYFVSRFGDDPGEYVGFIASPDDAGEAADAIPGQPFAMAVGAEGLIYLLDSFANDVIVLDGEGDLISRWNTGSTAALTPFDIAVDAAGTVYLSNLAGHQVLVYASSE